MLRQGSAGGSFALWLSLHLKPQLPNGPKCTQLLRVPAPCSPSHCLIRAATGSRVTVLLTRQPATCLPCLPSPQTKPCWGLMLQNSSSLRLLQCSWHDREATSHLKYSRRETALAALWGPTRRGELKVTAPVHLQKGMVCWMLQSEANRADGEECR